MSRVVRSLVTMSNGVVQVIVLVGVSVVVGVQFQEFEQPVMALLASFVGGVVVVVVVC